MLEEMQKKNEQMMQEKEASYQEHMKQLTEKMEKERAQLMADQEKVLTLKLQVFNCSISILSSTVMNQKLLEVRALYQFKDCSSPNTRNDKKTKNFNEPRLCIRKFFPEKKCFIFDRPAHRKHLSHLEQLQEEDLNPEFREQVADFCFYILSHSKAKTLSGGITVNGPRESLLLSFLTRTPLLPIVDNR
ncbi:hypothetical protein Celaphus_00002349, partial [Cervus elaphus hippelaphus]